MWETRDLSLVWEDPLENETAIHSSTLAWEIPWMGRNLVGFSPWDHKESDATERLHLMLFMLIRLYIINIASIL